MDQRAEAASSVERIQRHGELKKLRDLRRQIQRAPRKKRVLSLKSGQDEENDECVDLKDVEFRLQQDPTEVQVELGNHGQWFKVN